MESQLTLCVIILLKNFSEVTLNDNGKTRVVDQAIIVAYLGTISKKDENLRRVFLLVKFS